MAYAVARSAPSWPSVLAKSSFQNDSLNWRWQINAQASWSRLRRMSARRAWRVRRDLKACSQAKPPSTCGCPIRP